MLMAEADCFFMRRQTLVLQAAQIVYLWWLLSSGIHLAALLWLAHGLNFPFLRKDEKWGKRAKEAVETDFEVRIFYYNLSLSHTFEAVCVSKAGLQPAVQQGHT